MAEDQPTNKNGPKIFKRRRSEVISGVAVVISLPVLTFAWSIYKDIQDFKRTNEAQLDRRFTIIIEECRTDIRQERERAKEAENEIKADLRELRTQLLTRRR